MRGVVVVIVTIFAAMGMVFVGGVAIEPVGELVTGDSSASDIDAAKEVGADGVVQTYREMILVGAPLVLIGGMLVWGVAYYMRRERFVGGRRR